MNPGPLFRRCAQVVRLMLVVFLMGSAQAHLTPGAASLEAGTKPRAGQTIAEARCSALTESSRLGVQTHQEGLTAVVTATLLPPRAEPARARWRLEPYATPGVDPLAHHLIYLQKTSADL